MLTYTVLSHNLRCPVVIKVFLSVALLLSLGCFSSALAEQKHGWPTLTLSGGGYSLGNSAGLDGELLYGIKLGYEINGRGFADRLGIEGVFQQINGELKADKSDVDIKMARLDLLYLFDAPKKAKKLVPFFYHNDLVDISL